MKKSVIVLVIGVLLSLFFLAVAIPTMIIRIGNDNYRIRNLDPMDISKDSLLSEFKLNPSIELQGGNIATIQVDMSQISPDSRMDNYNVNLEALLARLDKYKALLKGRLQVLNYSVQEAIATDNSSYNIIAKFPSGMTNDKLQIMTTPGSITIWQDDSANANPNATAAEQAQKPFGDRKLSELTNDDIESVNVISDANLCIFNDPKTPRNYCLSVIFKPEARTKFQQALFATPNAKYPLLLVIDGAPVAVQSYGQKFNQTDPGRELDLYPVVEDSYDVTAILASIINDKPFYVDPSTQASNATLTTFNTLTPTLGANTLQNLKISLLAVFVVANVLLVVYFRKRSTYAVIANVLLAIWTTAALKIFGVVLDLGLIAGGLAGFLLFNTYISYFLYQIRSASTRSLTEDEVEDVYLNTKQQFFIVAVLTIIVGVIISIWGSQFMISMIIGFGFAILMGLLIINFVSAPIISMLFLKSKKWRIW